MAKKTYVKVGGVWKEVKNVWVNAGGVWRQKVIPKVNIGGIWKEVMQYLIEIYNNGVEGVALVKGFDSSRALETITRNPSDIQLKLRCAFDPSGPVTVSFGLTTDSMVDVTDYSSLKISLGDVYLNTSQQTRTAYLIVSNNKTGNYTAYVSRLAFGQTNANSVLSLDVSSLSGSYYVQVHMVTNDSVESYLHFNKLWLE